MTLEATIQANTAAITAMTAAFLAQGVTTTTPKAVDKPAAVKADKPAAAPKAEKAVVVESKAEPAGLDYDTQVKPRVLAVVKAKGRDVVDALLLENFSVKSAKEVKPADYQVLLDKLAEAESAEDVA